MMKNIIKEYSFVFSILLAMLFVACNNTSNADDRQNFPANSKTVQIQLVDSLGMLTLSVPFRYDTNFSWVHYSDCGKPCDEQKYRFQPKELPITKESGWYWLGEPKDSIERFTISHVMYFPFHDGDTAKNTVRHNHLKEQLISNPQNPPIIFDTIQKINDRYYSIFEMGKSDTLHSKIIVAVTTIKNNVIKFQYELLTRKNDSITNNFIKNSIDLIKTIRISKGI
jgi:hypothetical protein